LVAASSCVLALALCACSPQKTPVTTSFEGAPSFTGPWAAEFTDALARSTDAEKQSQLDRLADFHRRHAAERPEVLTRLRDAALAGDNLFEVLMDAVRTCSLGEITHTLFEVGGRYRRNV
jgi:methylmalonyl-CoA mutase